MVGDCKVGTVDFMYSTIRFFLKNKKIYRQGQRILSRDKIGLWLSLLIPQGLGLCGHGGKGEKKGRDSGRPRMGGQVEWTYKVAWV